MTFNINSFNIRECDNTISIPIPIFTKMARQYQYQYQYWTNGFSKPISISIVPILAIILTIAIFWTIFWPLWRHCYLKGTGFTTTFMKICYLMLAQFTHFVNSISIFNININKLLFNSQYSISILINCESIVNIQYQYCFTVSQ